MHARHGSLIDPGELRDLLKARDELEKRLLGLGNVVGVGVGEKRAAGRSTGRLAIRILVREKRAARDLPGEARVPKHFGGLCTDVVATGDVRPQGFMRRYRPAPCGVSIGREGEGGSLGCLVEKGGRLYLLGNNHVLALVNRGPRGTAIPQPAPVDGGASSGDVIGRLARFVPISFGLNNEVDAALARIRPDVADRRVIRARGGRQALQPPEVPPAIGLQVQKSGRSTGYRRGRIDAIALTVDVDFSPLGRTARFVNQFSVRGLRRPFSDNGDSGALVTTWPANQPVGLLFSGCGAPPLAFCNDIRKVTRALGVTIAY